MTFQRLNPALTVDRSGSVTERKFFIQDGSSGLINIGLENDEDSVTLEWVRKAYQNIIEHDYVFDISPETAWFWKPTIGEGNEFSKEQTLIRYINGNREGIFMAVDNMMGSGKIYFEKYILSFLVRGGS